MPPPPSLPNLWGWLTNLTFTFPILWVELGGGMHIPGSLWFVCHVNILHNVWRKTRRLSRKRLSPLGREWRRTSPLCKDLSQTRDRDVVHLFTFTAPLQQRWKIGKYASNVVHMNLVIADFEMPLSFGHAAAPVQPQCSHTEWNKRRGHTERQETRVPSTSPSLCSNLKLQVYKRK